MRKNYAVIAAGGLGTRLKDYKDNEFTKVLIELNGLSMISTQIKQLQSWGLENFIIITNPEFHDLIAEDVSKNYKDLNIQYSVQESPNGIADALSYAEDKVEDSSFSELTDIKCEKLTCLITSNHTIPIGGRIFHDWEDNNGSPSKSL